MKILFLVILIILSLSGFSQTESQNQSKYWYYRYQLRSKFMKAGEVTYGCVDPDLNIPPIVTGYSMPAARIDFNNQHAVWGDATTHLGWYIGILATEYRLLKDRGLNTSYTEEELYYAMKAFERLDLHAEMNMFPWTGPCIRNGFFGRDDVSTEFGQQYFPNGVDSDYIGYKSSNNPPKSGAHASQDQINYLCVGFALVVKCVDAGANYKGYYFVANAKWNADLMINYMAVHEYTMPIPSSPIMAEHSEDIIFNSYAFAKAGQMIQTEKWGKDGAGSGQYENETSFTYAPIWESWPTPVGILVMQQEQEFIRVQTQTLAAMGHSWRLGLVPVKVGESCVNLPYICGTLFHPKICHYRVCAQLWCYPEPLYPLPIPLACAPFKLPNLSVNITQPTLEAMAKLFGTEIAPLLHRYLHNSTDVSILNAQYLGIINSAPCQGPYWHLGNTGVEGWRSSDRFSSITKAKNGNPNSVGDFNGIDYMLFYNLWRLTSPLSTATYKNELHVDINGTFPNAADKYGSDANPAYYKAFESINISGTLKAGSSTNTNGNLTVRAPNGIDITNFTTEAGTTFDSDPTPFQCNSTGTAYQIVAATDPAEDVIDTAALMAEYKKRVNEMLAEEISKQTPEINRQIAQSRYEPIDDYVKRKSAEMQDQAHIFPNPSSGYTSIELKLYHQGEVRVTILDVYGRELLKPFSKSLLPGTHTISFDATLLAEGAYFYSINTGTTILNGTFIKK
jgi:hypothetical protein